MQNRFPTLRLAGVIRESIVDGPGLRFVLFTQGCPHHCPGCHNPQSWSPKGGFKRPISALLAEIDKNPLLQGVTFSGGEPFLQPEALVALGKEIKKRRLSLMIYSGYLFEEILQLGKKNPSILELCRLGDYLVDGPYLAALRDWQIRFRGSKNQRIIDLPSSLSQGQTILADL